jgi:hypothetical protein
VSRESSFLTGVRSGSALAGSIIESRRQAQALADKRREFEVDHAARERRHRDQQANITADNERLQGDLDMRRKAIEQELEFKSAENELRAQKRDQALRDRRALIELQQQAEVLMRSPSDSTTGDRMLALWEPHLGLISSEDPVARDQAKLLRDRMERHWQSTASFAQLKRLTEAEALGLLKPEDRKNPVRVAEALADMDYSDLKTEAAASGLDLERDIAPRVTRGFETNHGGLAPLSKAQMKFAIQAEVARKKAATPSGRLSLPLGYREIDGELVPYGRYTTGEGADVLRDPIAMRLMEQQGLWGGKSATATAPSRPATPQGQPSMPSTKWSADIGRDVPFVASEADFQRLKPGSFYIDANGKTRYKPQPLK